MAVQTKTTEKKLDMWWINFAIVTFLMFGLHFLLKPIGALTTEGVAVLCVFAGLIYGWGFCGLLWPSLLGLLAVGFTGLYTVSEIVVQGFGNDIVIFVIMMFVVVGNLNDAGVTKIFTSWLLTRKFLKGRPWAFSAMMLFVAFIVTAISNNFIAMFLVWGMWYSVFKDYGYKPYDPYVTLMMLGTIIGVTLGSFIFPFRNAPMIMLGAFAKMSQLPINYGAYMIAVIPLSLLLFGEYILICKYIFKPDVSKLANIDLSAYATEKKMGPKQIISTVVFVLVISAILLPTFLPAGSAIKIFLSTLGMTGLAIIAAAALLIIRVNGQPILDYNKVAKETISWDAIFMVVVIMLLSPILSNEATGINPFIVQTLMPILGGHSATIFIIIFAASLFILTNFFNNMIMGFLFLNIVAAFYGPLGIDPWTLMAILCVSMHLAILTPSASGQVGMLFGITDWVKAKDLYKATFITFAVWAGTYLIIGVQAIRAIFALFS